ncbi:COX15/CtaA family protein [Actinomadura sp. CNU-125]|uniref:COX15/CtaA family protein n=1 Tax=Actinomadura sp. CNU-125 TaxID=1904961 RepID=UPI0021CCC012|nr:COX15/CtaA family protein [Actinomadura sp. CNU-125]
MVTGTGPHAGDASSRRWGFEITDVTRVHSLTAWVTCALVVVMAVVLHRTDSPRAARRRVHELLALVVAQGALGYVQYFLGVPAVLVVLHMLGAVLLWIAAFRLFFALRDRGPLAADAPAPGPAEPAVPTTQPA